MVQIDRQNGGLKKMQSKFLDLQRNLQRKCHEIGKFQIVPESFFTKNAEKNQRKP